MSCLFNSLAPAVSLHPEVLRKAIAAYLKTDPKLLDDIKAKDIIEWTEVSGRYRGYQSGVQYAECFTQRIDWPVGKSSNLLPL